SPFLLHYHLHHHDLHSFPTRRSSDLKPFTTVLEFGRSNIRVSPDRKRSVRLFWRTSPSHSYRKRVTRNCQSTAWKTVYVSTIYIDELWERFTIACRW